MSAQVPRVLLTKSFIDSHDRAIKTIALALRDAGMEVVLIDYETPDDVVASATDEDVDVIGVSYMSGGQVATTEAIVTALAAAGRSDLPVVVGGVIRPFDVEGLEKAGVKAMAGDALLLRWGRWTRRSMLGPWPINEAMAGLDNSVIPWLKKRDIAILGWETPDYVPRPPGDLPRSSLHNFVLTILGVHLLDRADFDALSEAAASRKRWEFMLTIAPLPIPRGTGSPVNPIAMF